MSTQFTVANTNRAAGSQMDSGNFISEAYSKKLQVKFYKATVMSGICNYDWEGEIKDNSSKVIIRVRPTIVINDWEVNGTISYTDLVDAKIELLIDRAKYFAFKLDDVDKSQTDINLINESSQDAAEQMKVAIDADVLGYSYPLAGTALPSTVVSATSVLDWLVDAGTALDEENVPESGRWAVLPPWVCGMIKKSDLKDASLAGDGTSILRNGRMGMIDRFTIYNSNNLTLTGVPATGSYECMAGTKDAISFASQITKTETLRLETTFGDAMRGLNVYGRQVTKPEALVHMPATKA